MRIRPIALDPASAPGFLPQAVINRPLASLSRALDARTDHGHDDLDDYESAAFVFDERTPFTLKHDRGHPDGTVTLYLPGDISDVAVITALVGGIVRTLGLGTDALLWQRADDPEL
jgi:hypothetical protein